jgi:hypothetical protein
MNLLEVLASANGKVKGAAEYVWDCFGADAMYLDIGTEDLGHLASVIFDSDDGTVYAVEMFLPQERRAWRWIDERFQDLYLEACQANGVNPRVAFDTVLFETITPVELLTVLNELTADPNLQFEEDEDDTA